jgi:uncharacterized protein
MLIYLDSVICIYTVEGPPTFQVRAIARLAAMKASGDSPAISDLIWLECRVKLLRLGDTAGLAKMESFLNAANMTRLPLPTPVYDRACRIRALHNYKLADSLHLAAAVEGGCGAFLTNDIRLSGFPDIPVEVLP